MSFLDSIFKYVGQLRYSTTEPSPTNGDLVEWRSDASGRLLVNIDPGGFTWNPPGSPGPERVVKASNGKLRRMWATNTGGSGAWFFVFNHNDDGVDRPTNGSTAQIIPPVFVDAGKSVPVCDFGLQPFAATVGIYWGASSTAGSFTYASGATFSVATEYV